MKTWCTGPVGRLSFASIAALLAMGPATAQIGPSSPGVAPGGFESEIRRQQQRLEQPLPGSVAQPPGEVVVGPKAPPAEAATTGGPTFVLKGITFDHSAFLDGDLLDATGRGYIGRNITLGDLQLIVAAINKLYAERGIVTAVATVPPQNIDRGIVHIKLTEGRLGQVLLKGHTYTSQAFLLDRVTMTPGAVIDPNRLSADVTRFNRTHDVQLKALLQPGSTFGLSDVQLAVTELPANTLQLFTDNQGVRSTGRYQFGGLYRRNGILGIDDRFTLYATNARQTIAGNTSYNVPVGPWGSRLGISYSRGIITIIDGPFKALNVEGASQSGSLNFSHPLWVNQRWLIQANLAGSLGASKTESSGVRVTDDETKKGTAGISISHYGDRSILTIAPAFNTVDSFSNILERTRHFNTFTGTGSAIVQLPHALRLNSNVSWQISTIDLLPGDQLFQIGGPTTVRGYPTNSVSGDKGYLANIELHRDLSAWAKGLDTFVFVDHGAVFSTNPGTRTATSGGVGLQWSPRPETTVELTVARPFHELVSTQSNYEVYGRLVWRPKL